MESSSVLIVVLSYGRANVPTLRLIPSHEKDVVVLTSTDNDFRDQINADGHEVVVFDKRQITGRCMVNEETRNASKIERSAVFAYNYAVELARLRGYKYCAVFDDDYLQAAPLFGSENKYNIADHARISAWFLDRHPEISALCTFNNGNFIADSIGSLKNVLGRRVIMNTCVFRTDAEYHFESVGNGDYVMSLWQNLQTKTPVVLIPTCRLRMERTGKKTHDSIDYSNFFYARWSAVMIAPSTAEVRKVGSGSFFSQRFTTAIRANSIPKIVRL